MAKTYVTTFGYEYRRPPDYVDRVYDVRNLEDYPKDPKHKLEDRAQHIMAETLPGDSIAIGCDWGHDRSTFIAKYMEDHYPDVVLDHLDYDIHDKEVNKMRMKEQD